MLRELNSSILSGLYVQVSEWKLKANQEELAVVETVCYTSVGIEVRSK
jgi:hypothetical protein